MKIIRKLPRKLISACLVFITFPISIMSANAAILFSTSFTDWQADMTTTFSRHLDHSTFEINHANISTTVSGGIAALPDPSDPNFETARMDWNSAGNNVDLGRTAIFDRADTNFQWSFQISALETDKVTTDHGTQYSSGDTAEAHIIYNDRINKSNFDQVNAFTNVLSIGKFGGFDTDEVADGDPFKWDNDDFDIEITSGPELYAFAFEIVNNKKHVDTTINGQSSDGGLYSYGRESITVTDANNQTFRITEQTGGLPVIPGYYNDPATEENEGLYSNNYDDVRFIGIVSDTPFLRFEFNEDSRSDDIGIKNLQFAGNASPVPVPAAFWMMLSGLAVLSRSISKKRQVN
ncbi:MAG: VPLPA-CTERM sorting domain-containing protein [Gammaproteobacteria bacterium]